MREGMARVYAAAYAAVMAQRNDAAEANRLARMAAIAYHNTVLEVGQ